MATQLSARHSIEVPTGRNSFRGAARVSSAATAEPLEIEQPLVVVTEPGVADDHTGAASRVSDRATRFVNVAVALSALIIVSPLLVLVGLLVKLTSPGPVFYRQTRVGLDRRRRRWTPGDVVYDRRRKDIGGRPFRIYKFRTMRVDAERSSGAVWARSNDPRITPIGGFLRKTRLDEVPQLVNVILGDMNIVGPRPERPRLVMTLREVIDEYPLRQRARPGITGLAQINQSYDECIDDVRTKVRFDLEYIRHRSVTQDVRIMLCTIPVMLLRRGAR